MFNVMFNDKSVQFESATTAYDAAKAAELISREVIACKINGIPSDLTTVIDSDAKVELLTFADEEGAHVFRHTASHILAAAVKRLYPEAKLTIGPSIENGFYYDFDSEVAFSPDVLTKLEAEMKKIVKENLKIERFTLPRDEAKKLMEENGEPYKVLLIDRVPEGEEISFYKMGEFVDLCAGPHLFSTGAVKAFKLTQCTGAYWEGDAKNKMLQRVYGTAFTTKDALAAHLEALEEAKKRDHNKLGRELEIFTTVDSIGQGLPILLPKGTAIIQKLQRWIEDEEERRGYLRTKTPLMAKRDLYKISGHWDHYLDGMFILGDPYDETKECFALRPMTCPFQYQAYLSKKRSYRELPLRYGETSTLFRNEDSGEMHGLIRVRQFTISEGHLVLRPDQLEEEFKGCLELAKYCLDTLGLLEDCTFRFSQWDPNNTAKYEGTPEQWDEAQGIMKNILDNLGIDYKIGIDEAAFYGPKLDIQCKNVFGKEDTIVTIQIDMLLAAKFGMYYTDSDNSQKLPYIIHRTSMGCYERTLALLIEKYAGAFPMWLAPLQVEVIPVSPEFTDYAQKVADQLTYAGIKAHCDARNDTMRYKIREAQLQKIPYMLVVGERDMMGGTVSVRTRTGEDKGAMPTEDFIALALDEINTKKR
ncbi:MAG: threonine--tRNA ligase [Ruminococcaceae bacterium]|nr:threonine--tRNA ligase [Oscillospiraceae bacterium]